MGTNSAIATKRGVNTINAINYRYTRRDRVRIRMGRNRTCLSPTGLPRWTGRGENYGDNSFFTISNNATHLRRPRGRHQGRPNYRRCVYQIHDPILRNATVNYLSSKLNRTNRRKSTNNHLTRLYLQRWRLRLHGRPRIRRYHRNRGRNARRRGTTRLRHKRPRNGARHNTRTTRHRRGAYTTTSKVPSGSNSHRRTTWGTTHTRRHLRGAGKNVAFLRDLRRRRQGPRNRNESFRRICDHRNND